MHAVVVSFDDKLNTELFKLPCTNLYKTEEPIPCINGYMYENVFKPKIHMLDKLMFKDFILLRNEKLWYKYVFDKNDIAKIHNGRIYMYTRKERRNMMGGIHITITKINKKVKNKK